MLKPRSRDIGNSRVKSTAIGPPHGLELSYPLSYPLTVCAKEPDGPMLSRLFVIPRGPLVEASLPLASGEKLMSLVEVQQSTKNMPSR